jgi:hypothetical protein
LEEVSLSAEVGTQSEQDAESMTVEEECTLEAMELVQEVESPMDLLQEHPILMVQLSPEPSVAVEEEYVGEVLVIAEESPPPSHFLQDDLILMGQVSAELSVMAEEDYVWEVMVSLQEVPSPMDFVLAHVISMPGLWPEVSVAEGEESQQGEVGLEIEEVLCALEATQSEEEVEESEEVEAVKIEEGSLATEKLQGRQNDWDSQWEAEPTQIPMA